MALVMRCCHIKIIISSAVYWYIGNFMYMSSLFCSVYVVSFMYRRRILHTFHIAEQLRNPQRYEECVRYASGT
jgi:hypothetical protein